MVQPCVSALTFLYDKIRRQEGGTRNLGKTQIQHKWWLALQGSPVKMPNNVWLPGQAVFFSS